MLFLTKCFVGLYVKLLSIVIWEFENEKEAQILCENRSFNHSQDTVIEKEATTRKLKRKINEIGEQEEVARMMEKALDITSAN